MSFSSTYLLLMMFCYFHWASYLSFIFILSASVFYKRRCSLSFWWTVPLFLRLLEVSYVFGGFTLLFDLFFCFPFVLFDGYTITDKNEVVNTKSEK